ncbi:MAG TPA: tRNA (adenosine(37)-N6)-threonylcarbamoyltransferase complex dimerization subunit type 1 TsaB [Thermoanaerobaculia bacterium]|nr:tRNA (adenosine(37)-N6)-threonylcarbamoyltransferase complex dimerization subunit type 1 TsaB [Thermoanaerobaculia bacterium]
MLVLAADTSLPILSVALLNGDTLIGALALQGSGSRNEKLLPSVDWLLTENGVDRREIELFAVTRGPGSFTGVRIGLATLQGLALVLGRPVCTMSTHEAIAHGEPGLVTIVDDAGRGEFYVSSCDDGRESVAPHLGALPETGRVIRVADFLQHQNVAVRCARRALGIEQRGEGERHRDVTPIYVRLAEAEVKLQQKQNA